MKKVGGILLKISYIRLNSPLVPEMTSGRRRYDTYLLRFNGLTALVNPILIGTVFVLFMFVMVEVISVMIDRYTKHKVLLKGEEE